MESSFKTTLRNTENPSGKERRNVRERQKTKPLEKNLRKSGLAKSICGKIKTG